MYSFENDYLLGAHPQVLKRLLETNEELLPGYGNDKYCLSAEEKIKAACACPEAEVYFLQGGTQTNMVMISSILRNFEGVIAATTGHVSVHEAGAIEHTGHKVLEIPQHEGKIHADELKDFLDTFYADGNREHMVYPGMVYITHPTEYGTLYSKAELEQIADICHQYKLSLYLDGARLGYGLASTHTDVTLADIARICDAFYIGGTKNGLLLGEALVIVREELKEDFRRHMKQRGLMLAKGKVLGVQFETLFTGDLYMELARHANACMDILREGIAKLGYRFLCDSPSNQLFPIFPQNIREKIDEKYLVMDNSDEGNGYHSVRMVTSWATDPQQCKAFVEDLAAWSK